MGQPCRSSSSRWRSRAVWAGLVATLGLGALLLPGAAFADDEEGLPALAVQNRRHVTTHEFGVAVGVLPIDAFTKGITVSGQYSLHFNELYAWEVAHFFYSFPVDTDLRDDLDAFDLQPTPFERVKYFATSNFVFKPVYWKGSWLNDGLGYGEFFLLAGGGYGWMTRTERPVVDIGTGVRVYASEWVSVRFDVRALSFITTDDQQNELWIGLGASL